MPAPKPDVYRIVAAISDYSIRMKTPVEELTLPGFAKYLDADKYTELKSDEVKKRIKRLGGWAKFCKAYLPGEVTEEDVERQQVEEQAKVSAKEYAAQVNDRAFLDRFQQIAGNLAKEIKKLPLSGFSKSPGPKHTDRVVTVALSDLHFGSRLDPRELPYRYDFPEEARSLASIVARTNDFKRDYRQDSELVVWLGGDLIKGGIHDKLSGRVLSEQSADAIWLLTQSIRAFAAEWKQVSVYCSPGNHDRDEGRHHLKAVDGRWDSRATVIYFAVKTAVSHIPNVKVYIPRTFYSDWTLFDYRFCAQHGDAGFVAGSPSKAINVVKLAAQMQSVNLSEVQYGRKPFNVFIMGHVHSASYVPLSVGELITNPCLTPVDGYSYSIGSYSNRAGQALFETSKDYAVGDLRFLWVDEDTRKDKSLEKIIVPFTDF